MKGTSASLVKYSPEYSFNIEGANGLKLSLLFILLFNNSFALVFLGSAIIDLAPRARGPNSARPLNHPTTPGSINLSVTISNNCSSSSFFYI